jgi:Nucleoside-diphosphate-sugar epimerases
LHILILGAAGMVGRKLTERLLRDGRLGTHEITRMTLQDVVTPMKPANASIPISVVASDFADAGAAEPLIAHRPDVIFHLAAIVSGEAEAEFDKGYRINLDGTRYLIDAIRHAGGGYKPRLVFTSSIAVFGAPFPEKIGDEFFHTPLTSYGTQKSICELLINDYTRKGLLDGISIRCRRSACGRASRTRRLPASSPTSSASRWRVRRRCCRSPRTCGTGTPRRNRRSAFWSTPAPWTSTRWGRGATSACPACR